MTYAPSQILTFEAFLAQYRNDDRLCIIIAILI